MIYLLFLLYWPAPGTVPGTTAEPATEEIASQYQAHVRFLADDVLAGRETTFPGQKIAAGYLASQLALMGAETPFPESETPYFQEFTLEVTRLVQSATSLSARGNGPREVFTLGTDFFVRPFGEGLFKGSAAMVFAGYGLKTDFYDDYEGIQAQGRWVCILEGKPKGRGPESPFASEKVSKSLFLKYRNAVKEKALGIVFLKRGEPGEAVSGVGARRSMRFPGQTRDANEVFPILRVYESQWPRLLGDRYPAFLKAVAAIDQSERPQSFPIKRRVLELEMEVATQAAATENVVGLLPGNDPALREEYLVVSAHYDHIGIIDGAVYNGADDNGSGTATLLLLADHLRKRERRRGLILLFLTGEEQGLLGSEFFLQQPVVALDQIVAALNMDMIGRNGANSIGVIPSKIQGISTLNTLLDRVNRRQTHGLELLRDLDGFHSRSDHYNFTLKGIPAMFFFAGVHDHYHSPLDDWQRLDYRKLARVYRLIEDFVVEILNSEARPEFIDLSSGSEGTGPTTGAKQ